MEHNICKFVPTYDAGEEISILNFVCEKQADFSRFIIPATYSVHIVTSGTGVLHTPEKDFCISAGELFFITPGKPYYTEKTDGLEYMYISFLGTRAPALLERIKLAPFISIYQASGQLIDFWKSSMDMLNDENVDLLAQSVLLYTLAQLCTSLKTSLAKSENQNAVLMVKHYVDEHYSDPELSLKSICEKTAYSYKYVSTQFTRTVFISFNKYLQKLRLENAKRLMDKGMLSVKEISYCSGYKDALYFSRSFKKMYRISPREYMKSLRDARI